MLSDEEYFKLLLQLHKEKNIRGFYKDAIFSYCILHSPVEVVKPYLKRFNRKFANINYNEDDKFSKIYHIDPFPQKIITDIKTYFCQYSTYITPELVEKHYHELHRKGSIGMIIARCANYKQLRSGRFHFNFSSISDVLQNPFLKNEEKYKLVRDMVHDII